MKIKSLIVKGLIIGAITFSSLTQTTYASIKDNDIKVVDYYVTEVYKTKVYMLNNGAELAINDELGFYELFVEELSDWSVECTTKKELMKYLNAYNEHKYNYKKYDNDNITYEEECCEYRLSNGITVIKSKDIPTKDVYLPIFGGNLPYKCKDLNDAKKVVDTYLECIE